MEIVKVPNRAPGFSKNFRHRVEFVPPKSAPKKNQAGEWSGALKSLEFIKANGALPEGFSHRRFFDTLTTSVGAKIVSEHQGRIEKMLIAVPYYAVQVAEIHARHYAALFQGIGAACTFVIVCHPDHAAEMAAIATGSGVAPDHIKFVYSPQFDYTIWAQDAYVALNDAAGAEILLEGVCFPRGDDMTIADDVAAQSTTACLQSYLYFQGGNVLGSHDLTLIGMDYVMRNVNRYGLESVSAVVDRFAQAFGSEVLPLGAELFEHENWYQAEILSGYGYQPIFHIDMYVTPTGVMGKSGKEIVFLGRPEAAKKVVGRYSDIGELNNSKYNAMFDATEKTLATRFEVRYLPLWITRGRLGRSNFPERYYNLTFNNCIVESSTHGKSVLLPTYSSDSDILGTDQSVREALEAAAIAQWTNIGFKVNLMDAVEDLAYASGAVHCITKTLKRSAA